MKRPPSRSQGFTLAELMVVVVIAGILATLSVSGFSALTQSQKAKAASFELHSSLVFARSEAIKRNGNVTITPVGGSWQDGWRIADATTDATLRTQPALGGIVISSAPDTVTYTRSGRLPTTVLTMPAFQLDISETATSNVRCIKLELTGMPRTTLGACT